MNVFTQLDDVLKIGTQTEFFKGEEISIEGQLYRVQSGAIGLYWSDGGGLAEIATTGEYFGCHLNRAVSARVLTDSRVMQFPAKAELDCVSMYPRLFTEAATQRYNDLAQRFRERTTYLIREQLILTLLRMAERFGATEADGYCHLPDFLTHEVIASYLGTSRTKTTREISELKKAGAVCNGKPRHMAVNVSKLADFVAAGGNSGIAA